MSYSSATYYYYGLPVSKATHDLHPRSDIKAFYRLLFLAPSVDTGIAELIINNYELGETKKIEEVKKILNEELNEISKLIVKHNEESYKRKMGLLFKTWLEVYWQLNEDEIKEYCDFFQIERSELLRIKVAHNAKNITGPADINKLLDRFVIGQKEAKRNISFAFYLHLLRNGFVTPSIYKNKESRLQLINELPNPTMVLTGPTGSGKTFILNTLCSNFNIPFVKIDCASLTSSGYVGKNIEDYLYRLLEKVEFQVSSAEKGVVYFDEFDKLSEISFGKGQGSVGGVELQQEFLNIIESVELMVPRPRSKGAEPIVMSGKNLMFVFSGSFAGIENIIKKRLQVSSLGYRKNKEKILSDDKLLLKINHQDIMDYGLIPELVGRVNFIVPLKELNKKDIIDIMKKSSHSPLRAYSSFFDIHYDKLVIEEPVYDMIATEVLKSKTGARAINSVLQRLLNEYLFESPDNESKTYTITPAYFNKVMKDN